MVKYRGFIVVILPGGFTVANRIRLCHCLRDEVTLLYALRYYWRASRGHRLRPWRSPYLRWRMETFFGVHADRLTRQEFFHLLWRDRRRLRQFLRWAAEMEQKYFAGGGDIIKS